MAIDADGDAVFTWERHVGNGYYRVVARARSADGVLSPVQDLSAASQSFEVYPQVAVDRDGDAVFTWGDDGTYRVQARARSAAGALSAVQTVSANGLDPRVAVDRDGDAVFTWWSDGNRVQARARSATGLLSPVQNLSARGGDAQSPEVAVDRDGDAVFAWTRFTASGSGRAQARARSAAGDLSPVQDLSAGEPAGGPKVAVDATGDAVFAWNAPVGENSRVAARARSATGDLSPVQNLSAVGEERLAPDPEVAVDAGGDAVFTWSRLEGGRYRVEARARSAAGGLGPLQRLSTASRGVFPQHEVGIDADGDAVFTWVRRDAAGSYRVQARARSATGALSAVQNLSAAGRDAHLPEVAVGRDGDAAVTWQRFDTAGNRVQAAFGP